MKPLRAFLILLVLLLHQQLSHSQSAQGLSNAAERWLESLAEYGFETEGNDDVEYLISLIAHPININSADKEQLERFFFLTDKQIENLLYYFYMHGPILSAYELQGVEGFDAATLELLVPLIVTAPVEKQNSRIDGFALTRASTLLETPAGYRPTTGKPAPYQGDRLKLLCRSEITGSAWGLGLAIEKDAGEKLLNDQTSLPDFYSGYIGFHTKKWLRQLVAGTYRVSFGQGLALSNSYNRSMMADPVNIRLRSRPIHGYSSTDENNYLSGLASELSISPSLSVIPFFSYKKIDGTMADSLSISGINTSGLHRTGSEIARYNNVNELLAGTGITFKTGKITVETGGYHLKYSLPVAGSGEYYKQFQFSGSGLNVGWISYSAFVKKSVIFGELALNNSNSYGLTQGWVWEPDSRVSLSAKLTHFDRGYYSPYMSMGGGLTGGFSQLNLGMKLKLFPSASISLYHINLTNQWLKYQVDAPSESTESMIRYEQQLTPLLSASMQYRFRMMDRNMATDSLTGFGIETLKQHNTRLQISYKLGEHWLTVARIENCNYLPQFSPQSVGWLYFQDFVYTTGDESFKIHFRYCHFDTDDYNSRLYAMEPNVLYAFQVPSYSGNGSRIILNARYHPASSWFFYLKMGRTVFPNETSIGSGYDEINGDTKTDITFQIRYLIK